MIMKIKRTKKILIKEQQIKKNIKRRKSNKLYLRKNKNSRNNAKCLAIPH